MKLQIALDLLDLQKCLDVAKSVEHCADSFQIGLPLLLQHGVQVLEEFTIATADIQNG